MGYVCRGVCNTGKRSDEAVRARQMRSRNDRRAIRCQSSLNGFRDEAISQKGMRDEKNHHSTAFKLWLVHVDELILVEDGIDQEVGEGNGGHQRLDHTKYKTQQDGYAAVRHLQPFRSVRGYKIFKQALSPPPPRNKDNGSKTEYRNYS